MKGLLFWILNFLLIQNCFGKTWQVGSSRTYTKPSQVSTLVKDGYIVEIDSGLYSGDVTAWTANNLMIKGVGGFAHLDANGKSYGGKAIWVISGNNTRVESIEFSLCTVVDQNGAGIKLEGKNLIVSHCYFHNNDDGILANAGSPSNILIEYSEFGYNGYGDGYSHNLYIGHIDTLTFRYNYSHNALVGHELKSRANVNFIMYNRISDESAGTASRNIDLPNGGTAYLIGNVIEQGPKTQNSNIISYGFEGLTNASPAKVYAINNTIVNDLSKESFFAFQAGTSLFKAYNNIITGAGTFISGSTPTTIDTASNIVSTNISSFAFTNAAQYNYHLTAGSSIALNVGTYPDTANGIILSPVMEYLHPHNSISRCINGNPDIGAYELCLTSGMSEPVLEEISVFPNPTKGIVRVNLQNSQEFSVDVYSLLGRLILRRIDTNIIDISNFHNGIYILVIKQGEQTLRKKIYKQ